MAEKLAEGLVKRIEEAKRATPKNYTLPRIKEATNSILSAIKEISNINHFGSYQEFEGNIRNICEKNGLEPLHFWKINEYSPQAGNYIPNAVIGQIRKKSEGNWETIESFLISKIFEELINTENHNEARYFSQVSAAFFENRNTGNYKKRFYEILGRKINALEERQGKEHNFEKRNLIKERLDLIKNLVSYTLDKKDNTL